MHTAWTIPGAEGQPILGDAHVPDSSPRGVLVLCHGFKGYKDYGFFPRLAEAASAAGMIAHRFNFSHSGMTDETATFARPDLFERDTWGFQIRDLFAVAAAIGSGVLAGRWLPIVVFGHSRGGVTALLAAARGLSVAGVITAAAPYIACNLDEDQRAMLRRAGYLSSPSSRTGQDLRIGRTWLDEIESDPDAFDPCRAIAALQLPCLIVHGDADDSVSPQAARNLSAACDHRAELLIIPGANHTFNAANPLPPQACLPVETQLMFEAAVSFALRCTDGSHEVAAG